MRATSARRVVSCIFEKPPSVGTRCKASSTSFLCRDARVRKHPGTALPSDSPSGASPPQSARP
eukprot:scaffold613_cov243-Pinguiococcus_pyrenoidosus.AAC.19